MWAQLQIMWSHRAFSCNQSGPKWGLDCGPGRLVLRAATANEFVKHASPRPRIGDCSGHSSALGAKCQDSLASRASEGEGGGRLREMNRIVSGIDWGSGHLE
jgi:hypothetical protein